MFHNCINLEYDVNINIPNIENNDNMFKNCNRLIHRLFL